MSEQQEEKQASQRKKKNIERKTNSKIKKIHKNKIT